MFKLSESGFRLVVLLHNREDSPITGKFLALAKPNFAIICE